MTEQPSSPCPGAGCWQILMSPTVVTDATVVARTGQTEVGALEFAMMQLRNVNAR